MSENSQEDLESSLVKLDEKLPALVEMQSAYWNTTSEFQGLLSESGVHHGIKTTSSARRFTPQNLSYLRLVYLYSDNPEKVASGITVIVKPHNERSFKADIQFNKHYAYFWVQSFCEWFEISSNASPLKPEIKKVEILGTTEKSLARMAKDIEETIELRRTIDEFRENIKSELTTTRNLIAEAKIEKQEIEEEKTELKNELTRTRGNLDKLHAQNISAKAKLQKAESDTKTEESKKTEAQNNIIQLTQQTVSLNNEVSTLKDELQKLTNDRNLISDEYGPYVTEGKSQAKAYFFLIALPLGAILFSVYQVYAGASNLLTTDFKSASDILAALILRIPFAAIFGLAILYSWKLAFSMIQKIFKIHEDRLTLAKLLVVARETVYSSAKNLNISDHDKFQEQTALKIEVLKSHMARDLSDNFSYKPIPSTKAGENSTAEAVNDDPIEKQSKTL